MNTVSSFRALRLLTTAMLACMISSCALPPREAMRIVQRDGLIPYLTGAYSSGYSSGPAYASAAPFQSSRSTYVEPRPMSPIPYRTTYHTNRYSKADYNHVPYRPKTVTSHSSSRPSTSHRSATITHEAPEKPVVRTESSSSNKPAATASVTPEAPKKPAPEALPYGTPVAGRPGMVTSPFAQKQQLVDVTGLAPGDTVKDPYSGKLFRVPPTQQASAAESKPATEPPPADKPSEKPAAPSTPDAPKP